MIPFIDLQAQQMEIKTELDARIATVLAHGRYIMGPEVQELEERLADYVGVKHCISVGNGTDALLIALMALEIRTGDEVITSPFSFFAAAEAIAFLGAKPVFVDIDTKTYNMEPKGMKEAITARTKAILPVSLYGQCADMDAICEIAASYNLPVIEDGAQSFGATYKGRRSGALSEIACTSFFPTKPLGCYGDGGACFTDDEVLAKRMRRYRLHGQESRYYHTNVGVNSRLDTLQAAVLLAKFEILETELALREEVARRYDQGLQGKVITPYIESWNTSAYAQYTIRTPRRSALQERLRQVGIPTAVHYPTPIHLQPVFSYLQLDEGCFPQAESAAKEVLSLPMGPWLTLEKQKQIIQAIVDE